MNENGYNSKNYIDEIILLYLSARHVKLVLSPSISQNFYGDIQNVKLHHVERLRMHDVFLNMSCLPSKMQNYGSFPPHSTSSSSDLWLLSTSI
jgi:hypothetical protein